MATRSSLCAALLLLSCGVPSVFAETPTALAQLLSGVQGPPQAVQAPLLARISTHYGELIEGTRPPSAARELAQKSLDYAKQAVERDPKNAAAHLAVARAYGHLTDFVSNQQKLEYSRLIHEEAQKALALDPALDGAWHVLGRWNYGIATVNPMLKTLAKIVYGTLPPATVAEAIRDLKKASELAPRRIMHHSELARIYSQQGDRAAAESEWRAVLALPAQEKGDETDLRAARAALASH